jgi:hypothetical protein
MNSLEYLPMRLRGTLLEGERQSANHDKQHGACSSQKRTKYRDDLNHERRGIPFKVGAFLISTALTPLTSQWFSLPLCFQMSSIGPERVQGRLRTRDGPAYSAIESECSLLRVKYVVLIQVLYIPEGQWHSDVQWPPNGSFCC